MTRLSKFASLFLLALSIGCTIDPDDRCLKGFTWDEDIRSCRKNPDTDSDTSDLDGGPGEDSGPDSDTEENTGEDGPTGMGESCTADGNECDTFEANYCLFDPTNPAQGGICTIKDCQADECPNGYQCCNIIMAIVCAPDEAVENILINHGSCPP